MARHLLFMTVGALAFGALLLLLGVKLGAVLGWAPLLVCAGMMMGMGHGHGGHGGHDSR